MEVGRLYSHKGGLEFIQQNRLAELEEVFAAIRQVDACDMLRKQTAEKTKKALLFSPDAMNHSMKSYLAQRGWTKLAPGSKKGFSEPRISIDGGRDYREMDGIKNKVGLEIQFGKYAFMGYDIFSKMPIFASYGLIDCGIEVVAMPSLIPSMSTGVSSFSQIEADMRARGVADLDIPTLVIGIECKATSHAAIADKRARFAANPEALLSAGEVARPRSGAKPGPK